MRILYASHRPPYPFFLGGAARCAHRLLLALAEDHGVACAAVGWLGYGVTPWAMPPSQDYAALGVRGVSGSSGPKPDHDTLLNCGYPIRLLGDFTTELPRLLAQNRPDIVWTQLEGAREILGLARKQNVQGLLYVHDAEDDPRELRAAADLGCHIVCSSEFLAREVALATGRSTHAVYPASDWYFGIAGDMDGCVTMINPHAVKGLDTFFEIARRMPAQHFLLQESWKLNDSALAALQGRLATLANVTFQHRVSDMRQVYRRTKVLLIPSIWEEGFGMVAVEAQSCGIPVIASARGGLPESVGDGGMLIDAYRDVDAWTTALTRLLADPEAYARWSARALAHARTDSFTPRQLALRFLEACRAPPPRLDLRYRVKRMLADGISRVPVLRRAARLRSLS